ncbi:hypothetical protein KCU92_g378, partial [Aureobasidium melanogenum]
MENKNNNAASVDRTQCLQNTRCVRLIDEEICLWHRYRATESRVCVYISMWSNKLGIRSMDIIGHAILTTLVI